MNIGLDGMRDMYVSLGVPMANLKIAMPLPQGNCYATLTSEEGTLLLPTLEQLIRGLFRAESAVHV